ncbi:MAG: T9SS type A sorting domain-containing protein [Calditrichaeota bacterium]|nr:T9SS type A sorting domain-containing protein [Calditrichota bacterium]
MDESGNEHHGTLTGNYSFSEGIKGTALYLDGTTNTEVDIPSLSGYSFSNNELTVSLWVKRDYQQTEDVLARIGDRFFFRTIQSSQIAQFGVCFDSNCGSNSFCYSSTIIEPGKWYHLVGVWDGSKTKIYVNGILEGESSASNNSMNFNNEILRLGSQGSNGEQENLAGFLDEVRIYDKALTSDEIHNLYLSDKNEFLILSINDVPNDQGRKVRLKWLAHSFDESDSSISNPVTYYSIWRKHDPQLTIHKKSATPDGEWDFITEVPAVQDNQYSVIVPTLADSNKVNGLYYSTFFVRAHTADPTIHWETEPDSGYSVDNLSPAAVSGLNAELVDDNIQLTWNENTEKDIAYYAVYRDTVNDFKPSSIDDAISIVTSPEFEDKNIENNSMYYYRVSAIDYNGNESPLSNEVMVNITKIETGMHPLTFQLFQNYPNPFNPTTQIKFSLPEQANLQLVIFDANGKQIRNLFQGALPRGVHSFIWDGKNEDNKRVSSGIYYFMVKTKNRSLTKKMLLIK